MGVEFRKIYDFTADPNKPIPGGKVNEYWASEALEIRYNKIRFPQFNFKSNIDYIDQSFVCKQYNIKGLEYGNWVTQNERLNFLVSGHISLFDLQKIMNFKKSNIGLNGKLGIAFGARGTGGAIAHFEPIDFMINLTRKDGWRSLAHEYGHAIDFYFGGFYDQSKQSFSLSNGHSTKQIINLSEYKTNSLRYLMNDLINTINSVVVAGKLQKSESYKSIEKYHKGDEYYFRRTEIFARFFERYIMYKLSKKGIRNFFLAKDKYSGSVYVTKLDFARALPKMEKLLIAMRNTLK